MSAGEWMEDAKSGNRIENEISYLYYNHIYTTISLRLLNRLVTNCRQDMAIR